ncbi:PQQ-dependent sugar dehydrogenase [Pseudomonadota bacterium]
MKSYFHRLTIRSFLLWTAIALLHSPEENNAGAASNDAGDPLPHQVLDCRIEQVCEVITLEYTITNCERRTTNCAKTKQGLEKVAYITDPMNYIEGPFTQERFSVEYLDLGLRQPRDFEFLSDGTLFVAQKSGNIVVFGSGGKKTIFEKKVVNGYTSGMLGLAIHPDFESNGYLYVYYTYSFDDNYPVPENKSLRRNLNRVSRLTVANGQVVEESTLIDAIPGSMIHVGGRLEFGPDGKLYATTGDANELKLAQQKEFLGGKVLRLNADGSIPDDNPFATYVYSMGHRNPQGMAWNLQTGHLYTSEHGPWKYDEINRIIPGTNYGWGGFKCDEVYSSKKIVTGRVKFPVDCFKKWTMAPSGMEYVWDRGSPWFGSLFVASLRGKHVRRYIIDKDTILLEEIFYVPVGKDYPTINKSRIGTRIRDIEYRDGSLYVMGNPFGMVKLTPIE